MYSDLLYIPGSIAIDLHLRESVSQESKAIFALIHPIKIFPSRILQCREEMDAAPRPVFDITIDSSALKPASTWATPCCSRHKELAMPFEVVDCFLFWGDRFNAFGLDLCDDLFDVSSDDLDYSEDRAVRVWGERAVNDW
jgi:hypothetical protein